LVEFRSDISFLSTKAWNFGVDEKLRGSIQIVDITDDCTGEPHRLAETNIPMVRNI
jgi:hypothetical protein